ncbi:hypothetical protein MPTK1_7g08110 [Marchantia polymorpha subsp. ruderalis]|uniref:Protein HGH1 homolog n=2 Tax=Marchantia polymorpha TaxID=3197 RepID=A0A176VKY6_MARPO|nr:hypothetical protein AXG93_421s1130 [Marchantia polymorpha subsp. ruderalis]PTQ29189.1 hypothetical protein MARPO_0146s0011 [Marchantia polymorpha]BBN16642.1 hypothetical protein Mp_7g08110 [Marchantia polymorpha subsp. ruderalis]|eukprot:PTQ29189.1 hypothetical protein MARPO_0146s0011 [Marchantia polymorpha]
MSADLDDLVGFLASPSPQLKKAAVDIVQGLTGTEDGLRVLSSKCSQLLPPLLNLLADTQEIAQPAAEALVNLSQDNKSVDTFLNAGAVEKVMELIGKSGCGINRLLVMLLVNLTQVESGAKRLLQEGDEKLAGLNVSRLVRFFTRFSSDKENEDAFEHVAPILVNITRLQSGRKLILDQSRGLFKQILPQIDSRSLIRRQGVAGTVRNCCFEAEEELPSLLLASSFLWPALLLPLAGKRAYSEEDTDKMPLELATPLSFERDGEDDPQVRIEAADALYLIALQEGGRRAFWNVNGTRIIQVGYEYEEDPKVMEAYERLGALIVQESFDVEEDTGGFVQT